MFWQTDSTDGRPTDNETCKDSGRKRKGGANKRAESEDLSGLLVSRNPVILDHHKNSWGKCGTSLVSICWVCSTPLMICSVV